MRMTSTSWVFAATAAALLLPVAPLSGCLAQRGAPCSLDSDCLGGLVCALDGVCRPPDQARPDAGVGAPTDVGTGDTLHADSADSAQGDAGPSPDAGGCVQPGAAWVCGGAYAKHTVTNLSLPSEGHGAARLAVVANPILEDSFSPSADTPIHLELGVDGTLAAGCAPHTAWVRDPDDVGDVGDPDSSCQPVFQDAMPVDLPGLVSMVVYDAVLDPATLVVTGLLDVDEVVASMAPALQETARGMFDLDVDTDDDGTPDMCSVIVQVTI